MPALKKKKAKFVMTEILLLSDKRYINYHLCYGCQLGSFQRSPLKSNKFVMTEILLLSDKRYIILPSLLLDATFKKRNKFVMTEILLLSDKRYINYHLYYGCQRKKKE
jgi:hypothetical protein